MRIFRFAFPYKFYFLSGLFFLFLLNFTSLVFPYIIGKLVDITFIKSRNIHSIGFVLLFLMFIQAISSLLKSYFFSILTEKTLHNIRLTLYKKLLTLPISFYNTRRVGELFTRITADVTLLQHMFSYSLPDIIKQTLILIIVIVILAYLNIKLMLFILIILALMIPVFVFLGQSINMYFRKLQDKLGQSNAIVNEVLHNIYTVKAFTNELFEIERYEKTLQSLAKSYLKAIKLKSYFNVIFTLLSLGCIVSVIWYNAILIKKGHVSAGSLLSSVLYINLVSKAIAGLGIAWGDLQRALGASHRILQIIQEKEEVNLIEKYKEHSHTLKGEIQFREVNFSYPTREGIKVLHNINFSIKAGEKVAFVGPSGVGKSTITQLIMGFYNTQKGTIKIDKKDIQEYNISFLRKNIGIVPQDIVVFNGTIRENIAYGKPGATEEEIVDAAQKGNLLTFIKTLPNEFDTVIGEKGITLSGGQRQRIAIARTILKSPSILILDEATSSLDSVSEIEVREALEEIMIGRTTILITHQLSNIYNMDRIYTLKQGRIIKVSSTKEIKGASAICI